eukprot:s97_g2.t1
MFKKGSLKSLTQNSGYVLFSTLFVMGSTVETSPAVGVEAGTPAVVLGAAPVEGEMPAAEAHLNEVSGDQAKHSEGVSPMTPKNEELTEEDAEAIRAAKRAKLESEEEKAEDLEVQSIRKCMHHCQAALEYVARQQKSIQELQQQLLEIGAVAHHSESCQKYSLAVVNQAAEHLRNGVWQLTGNKHESKTTVKSMLQQLVTATNKGQAALTKLSENMDTQNKQFQEQFQRFADSILQLQGQMADSYAAARGAPAPSVPAPAPTPMPSFPPAPLNPESPGDGSAPTAMAAAAVPAPGATTNGSTSKGYNAAVSSYE